MKFNIRISIFLLFIIIGFSGISQVQTPRYNTFINENTKGFYEYLPQGYEATGKVYPLIIFLHGKGDLGNGDAATLPRVLTYGLPKLIKDGKFPVSFTVNDSSQKFIVISPEFVKWPAPQDVEAVINYAISHYRVNVNRVYLTGLSMGGGGVWDYAGDNSYAANRLAAIVPICGSSYAGQTRARVIAAANLPVWATHNSGDDVVGVHRTHAYIDNINQLPAPVPAAKKTIFNVIGHDAWTKTYDPNFKEAGKNIYEWMLGYQRTALTAGCNSPVCFDSVLHLSAWNIEGASYSWTGPGGFTSTLKNPHIFPVMAATAGTYTVTITKGDSTASAATAITVNTPGIFYRDADQDGYGNDTLFVNSCRPPRGYTNMVGDCDDGSSKTYPGAIEICDGKDNDCDGQIDEGIVIKRFYLDKDKDGWGSASVYKDTCAQPVGYAIHSTDCNDAKASVYPGALEIKDGLDNDCDGKIDDSAVAAIQVNVYAGTNAYNAADWNNWNVNASLSSGALKYADASASAIVAVLSKSSAISDNGATYGGSMAPPEVLRYLSYSTTERTLTLNGLSTGKLYSLTLYASKNASGYSTVFTVNDSSVTIVTDKNKDRKASFLNLVPSANGQIIIRLRGTNTYNYLNGFSLIENKIIAPSVLPQLYTDAEKQTELLLAETAKIGVLNPALVSPFTLKDSVLKLVPSSNWTSGFFPGVLWNLYEYTGKHVWAERARSFTAKLTQEQYNKGTHDIGFIINSSFGAGYRLTQDTVYKKVIIQSAKTLATRFNQKVGSIRSWDWNKSVWHFPVIIDNMMNLELLFAATKLSGDSSFYKIAVSHANVTLKNHFRSDYSSFHVVDYDTLTGAVRKKMTYQGYNDASAWARGQAWGLYGFTMCYRETGDSIYLKQAEKIAAYLLTHVKMPADKIPYWDFDAPRIPNEPRDASTAAIMASSLYELIKYNAVENRRPYRLAADNMMKSLTEHYRSAAGQHKGFLLTNSTGSKPSNSELDQPLIYADYYFLEALLRSRDTTASDNSFNQYPLAKASADQTIALPENTVTLNGSATDPDGTIAAYHWCKVSGPGQFTINNISVAAPVINNLVQGVYIFRLTVTDNAGAISSDDVQITVEAATAVTGTKSIKINLFGGTNPYNNAEWNNWNIVSSLGSGTLKYNDASVSSVSATLSQSNGVLDNGATFGGTMAPAEVLRYTSSSGVARTLTFSGLAINKNYSLELYASRNNSGQSTTVSVSGATVTIVTDHNQTNKAIFTNLKSSAEGKLVVTIKSINTYNYINGLILTEEPLPPVTQAIKVNIYGGVNAYSNTEWNNWNVTNSLTIGELRYSNAGVSTVAATLSQSNGVQDNGATYGGTMAPPEVLRYTSSGSIERTLVLNGLDILKTYNLELYASRNSTGNSTVFTINATAFTVTTDKNKTNKILFLNVKPATGGQIVVKIKSLNNYNYLNGFILTETSSASEPVTMIEQNTSTSENMVATMPFTTFKFKQKNSKDLKGLRLQVIAYPNPSASYFILYIKSDSELPVEVKVRDATGRIVEVKQNMAAGGRLEIGRNFRPGIYYAEVTQGTQHKILKLIKTAD